MKTIRSFFFLLCFSLIAITSFSQNDSINSTFVKKYETLLRELDSSARGLRYKKSITNRRIIMNGGIGETNKSYKQKIKYYKSGAKKEELTIYSFSNGKKIVVLHVLKFNEKIYLVEYFEPLLEKEKGYEKTVKEVLIDGRLYRKTFILK